MGGRVLPSLQIKQGVTNTVTGRRGREIFPSLTLKFDRRIGILDEILEEQQEGKFGKEEVKVLLRISSDDTSLDSYLEAVIPLLIDFAEEHCNNKWGEELPGGVKLFVAKAAEYLQREMGVEAESLGDYSISLKADFPDSIMGLLPKKRVEFV